MENIHLKQLKQLKHRLATCLKTPETLENTVSPRGHGLSGGEMRWRRPPLPTDGARWMGADAGVGIGLPFRNGRGGWWRGASALREEQCGKGPATQERRRSRHFMLGEGAGKKEHPAAMLRRKDHPKVQYGTSEREDRNG
jgi:hypothetical protein